MSPELLDALSGIGFTGGLIAALIAYARGYVVTGSHLAKVETTCDAKVAALEAKLDAAAAVAIKQSEAQATTISVLHETLRRVELQVAERKP